MPTLSYSCSRLAKDNRKERINDMRYNKYVRWILVRIPRKWSGEWLHNKILDYLYPDDAEVTFK